MNKAWILVPAVLILTACDDPKTADKVLRQQGYTEIVLKGHELFWCGRDDTFTTAFQAKAPGGEIVNGAVCNGWGKGATIRFE